ncbi:recombinase family protein [Methylorubrum sp. POS3]|uniref:recombinase family protein n=1 Tax=Methylorubrum sp. POS3 TaxID=2998492 RepID=UPI00372C7095
MSKTLKPAIAYLRVSTLKQGEEGHGFELQMTRIREFARHAGYEVVETFRDAHTGMGEGSVKERPGAIEAIRFSHTHSCPIIVDGLDRFSRNTKRLEELITQGKLTVISAKSGNGASRAVIMGEAARGQREGELISQSTKRALQKLKEQGIQLGNRTNLPEAQAMGATANKAKADKLARALLPDIQTLRQAGKKTAQEIAGGLNELGRRTSRGELWKATNIRRVLARADELMGTQKHQEQAKRYDKNPLWGAF